MRVANWILESARAPARPGSWSALGQLGMLLAVTSLAGCDGADAPLVGADESAVTEEATAFPVWEASPVQDRDFDGVPDAADNCPFDFNADQLDADADGTGDACDGRGILMDAFPDPDPLAYETYGRWSKLDLTWTLASGPAELTDDAAREAVGLALQTWADASALTFSEVADAATADLVLSMEAPGDHGDSCGFGPGTIAHSFFPSETYPVCPYGKIHFNRKYTFTTDQRPWSTSPIDYQSLVLHEVGHALGLVHTDEPDAVMWKYYTGSRRVLHADDVAGIQSLYGDQACEPLACDAYPDQCGALDDGCGGALACGCPAGMACFGTTCVDACDGVICDECQRCVDGACGADPAMDGHPCEQLVAGPPTVCSQGVCAEVDVPAPPPSADPWVGEPYWRLPNCVPQQAEVTLCVETTGYEGAPVDFTIYEVDATAGDAVVSGATLVLAGDWAPEREAHVTCMTWSAWWTDDDGYVAEYALGVVVDGSVSAFSPGNAEALLHVGYWYAPAGAFCQ